jgi:hypothetical protein
MLVSPKHAEISCVIVLDYVPKPIDGLSSVVDVLS